MRSKFWLLIIPILILAACNNAAPTDQAPPTDLPPVPTDTPQVSVIVTRAPREEGELEVPGVGTLVASETEDPEIDLIFTTVRLTRSNNNDDEFVEVVINGDGSFVRNGIPGQLSPEQITNIDDMIDDINFFGLQGTMLGPAIEEDDYRYCLTVERGATSRTITSQEGFMPAPYRRLVGAIFDVGFRIGV